MVRMRSPLHKALKNEGVGWTSLACGSAAADGSIIGPNVRRIPRQKAMDYLRNEGGAGKGFVGTTQVVMGGGRSQNDQGGGK